MTELGFIHRWVPPATIDTPTLLLLHGTGGDEEDLIGLGMVLLPGGALLSPRGKTLEQNHPRWFRRLAPGVFDEADLEARTHELADFLAGAATTYDFDTTRVVAVGFSNGANIAASLLMLRPEALAGAVLFRAQVPFEKTRGEGERGEGERARPLSPLPSPLVFLSASTGDPMVPPENAERLASQLRDRGAGVALHWESGGHDLTTREIEAARQWLAASGL